MHLRKKPKKNDKAFKKSKNILRKERNKSVSFQDSMIPNLNFWLLQSVDACEDFDLTKFLKWSASQWMRVRVCNKESEALSDGDRCQPYTFMQAVERKTHLRILWVCMWCFWKDKLEKPIYKKYQSSIPESTAVTFGSSTSYLPIHKHRPGKGPCQHQTRGS